MAVEDLYGKFSTGKKPTGDDFKELIDYRGAKGDKGDKGDVGAKGAQGDKGVQGDRGLQGAQGLKGDTGTAGAQGAKGDTGAGLTGTATAESALATDAELTVAVAKINSIIAKLKARGVVL